MMLVLTDSLISFVKHFENCNTHDEALRDALQTCVKQFNLRVNNASDFMTTNQIEAVISIIHSASLIKFIHSDILKYLKMRDTQRAAYFFKSLTKRDSNIVLDLVKRRAVEKVYFLTNENKYNHIFSSMLDPYEILDLNKNGG